MNIMKLPDQYLRNMMNVNYIKLKIYLIHLRNTLIQNS